MKIALHGFGTYAIVFRHLVETARRLAPDVEWAAILPTPHHLDVLRAVIRDEDILSLQDAQARDIAPVADIGHLETYVGSIYADIEAEKRYFKHRPAWQQLARADEIYRLYKTFLQQTGATHVLISQIEAYEGKMLAGLARELGLEVIVPCQARILGGVIFTADAYETLPARRVVTAQIDDEARAFVRQYRRTAMPVLRMAETAADEDDELDAFRRPLIERVGGFVRRSLARPDLFEIDTLRAGVLNNLPWLRDRWWSLRVAVAARQYDVASPEELPSRFIYYPLQTTPESSINTPAPYFVDQMRVIDAIRFAMPNDHLLVVKEHPVGGIPVRPVSFARALRRRAGVVVAQYRMDSRALIERAACTVSVTGTATFEAFLLGRPALTLGPNLASEFLGGPCPIEALPRRLRDAIARPPSEEAVVRAVAEILSVRQDCYFSAPGLPGEPVLRRRNIERLLAALLRHIGAGAAST
ncbi:MAG: hypothetical protein IT537_23135 [Hyphomicrobiales bacterium]|nr:hypothetical protein [Hyphomicrobiales bacterium]